MITTSALCAHLEGTFYGRLEAAKRAVEYNPSDENRIRLSEIQQAYDLVYGILYQFGESNATDNDNTLGNSY